MTPTRRPIPPVASDRDIPRRATLLLLGLLLGAAGAVGATPDAVPVLPDGLDPLRALEMVYGKLDTGGGGPTWTSPDAPGEPLRVRIHGVLPFRQDGAERMFLITELVPEAEDDFKCHACAPGVGAATFTRTPAGWRVDVRTPYVMDLGSYGEATEPALVQVGPERYAVVFRGGGVGQGYFTRVSRFFLELEEGVREALEVETHADNSGACDPDPDMGRPCFAYDSSLEFVPGKSDDYFDLRVTTTGPGEGEFKEETVYAVVDGTYRVTHERTVDYRMVVHPVSGVELPRIILADRPEVERAVNDQLEALAGDMMCAPGTPEENGSYDASVEVAYADHDVFSVAVLASFHCGGAHPVNGADLSETFDLRTGRSVRLRELFEDYGRDSAAIAERYVATLSAEELEGCEDVLPVQRDRADHEARAEEDFAALADYGFTYTISAEGLVLRPMFPNVIAACAHPSTVPFAGVLEFASDDSILLRVAGATPIADANGPPDP